MLHLTKRQRQLSTEIWQKCTSDLAAVKAERDCILRNLQVSGAAASLRQGIRPDRASETFGILQQSAALAENSAVQQEIVLHSHRLFSLQVTVFVTLRERGLKKAHLLSSLFLSGRCSCCKMDQGCVHSVWRWNPCHHHPRGGSCKVGIQDVPSRKLMHTATDKCSQLNDQFFLLHSPLSSMMRKEAYSCGAE